MGAFLLPDSACAYDGDILKDQVTAFDKFISSAGPRIGLGLVALVITVLGALKNSGALLGTGILSFVFLYLAQKWIETTYTLLV